MTALCLLSAALLGGCTTSPELVPFEFNAQSPLTYLQAPCDTREFLHFAHTAAARYEARPQDPDSTTFVSAPDLPMQEIHDCQRLVRDGKLGSLVALLVSSQRVANSAGFAAGKVVAEIVSYDSAYTPLGIGYGRSCLWLRGDPASTSNWIAVVQRPTGGGCAQPFSPDLSRAFRVNRLVLAGARYPSSGRWMWDSINGNQFVGIRCGDAWCEFGATGFNGTAAITHPDSVPGWYDEQLLSYIPGPGMALQLSGVLGRIAPAAGLHSASESVFTTENGAPVATITLLGTDTAALRKYRRSFEIPANVNRANLLFSVNRGRYRSETGQWRRVLYNPHKRHAGAGAVRWSWYELDEKAWFPCGGGCCVTEELGLAN